MFIVGKVPSSLIYLSGGKIHSVTVLKLPSKCWPEKMASNFKE